MTYDPDQLAAAQAAAQALIDAGEDAAAIEAALADLEAATMALQGPAEDMSMAGLADKTPEDKATLKAKLAKAAFGG